TGPGDQLGGRGEGEEREQQHEDTFEPTLAIHLTESGQEPGEERRETRRADVAGNRSPCDGRARHGHGHASRIRHERLRVRDSAGVDRNPHVSTATLRGARAVGIVCAVLFFVPTVLSFVYPNAFLYAPYHRVYERLIGAVLAGLALRLLLSLRDPGRNAAVFAVLRLVIGTLAAATLYTLVFDSSDLAPL